MFKNRKIAQAVLLGLSLFTLNSCEQDEGVGGNSHIKGIVVEKTYLQKISNTPLSSEPAKDEEVFLLFGSETVVGEDVNTSFDGSFEFNYLWAGSYTVFAYTDSTLNGNKKEVKTTLELDKNESLCVDTIFINKIVDWDDGNSSLSGNVIERIYNEDFSILLSEVPATDEDIFLSLNSASEVLDDMKTGYTGIFEFANLWPGDYEVYCYSDTSLNGGEVATITEISINDNEAVDLGTIYVDKVADWDDGTATITGIVKVIYYDGSTITEVSPAQDQEVFLVYNGHDYYDERIRTGYNGTFRFNNLILGDYTIYVYSENVDDDVEEDDIVSAELTITETGQEINLGTMFINNK